MRISLFGNFGSANFGNELTLQTVHCHLRRLLPKAEFFCICSGPETVAKRLGLRAVRIAGRIFERRKPRSRWTEWVRKAFVGVPRELGRWRDAVRTLRGADVMLIPGTGLLTDAYGLMSWGPYGLFKWCLAARLCRCRILFVSVGAGPIHSALGRCLVKTALSLGEFRSFRDRASLEYLRQIGLKSNADQIFPDLVFSLPSTMIPHGRGKACRPPVVGVGLMEYAGKYGVASARNTAHVEYLEELVTFAEFLLGRGYGIRLLIGDLGDQHAAESFRSLLRQRLGTTLDARVLDHAALSAEDVLTQLAETDFVVATRFHNVLLALLLNKPVMAISFHHKCSSLMEQMGLSEYCLDINTLAAGRMVGKFQQLEENVEKVKCVMAQGVQRAREVLSEQYGLIVQRMSTN